MSGIDPARQRAEARRWLGVADEDLRVVALCLAADPAAVGAAAYHCQQAAGKLLKALHVAAATPFRKTHDLEELAERAAVLWPALSPHIEAVSTLTGWGFSFRYPHSGPGFEVMPDRHDIEATIRDLQALREAVSEVLETR
jgi:HEPN domain-containing protein